jgi:hypothetical protein
LSRARLPDGRQVYQFRHFGISNASINAAFQLGCNIIEIERLKKVIAKILHNYFWQNTRQMDFQMV